MREGMEKVPHPEFQAGTAVRFSSLAYGWKDHSFTTLSAFAGLHSLPSRGQLVAYESRSRLHSYVSRKISLGRRYVSTKAFHKPLSVDTSAPFEIDHAALMEHSQSMPPLGGLPCSVSWNSRNSHS